MPELVFLGIEIGGTKLQLGLGPGDGELLGLHSREVDPAGGAEAIRGAILDSMTRLLAETGLPRPSAVGIGFGGPVDPTRGRVVCSNHVKGWDGFPLTAWAQQTLGIPLAVLQNDSDTAALGEARFGAGRGVTPLLYVNSGSGVGGGLVIEGRIYHGAHGVGALEIGHLRLDSTEHDDGERTLESLASGWAIGRAAEEALASGRFGPGSLIAKLGGPEVTGREVGEAAIDGDPVAMAILDRATRAMGAAVATAVNLLVPERVVLGGGVAQLPDALWREPIRRAAMPRIYAPLRERCEIVTAELGQLVVVHGALALASDARVMHSGR